MTRVQSLPRATNLCVRYLSILPFPFLNRRREGLCKIGSQSGLLALLLTNNAFSLSSYSKPESLLQIEHLLHQSLPPNPQRNAMQDRKLDAFCKKCQRQDEEQVKRTGMVGYVLSSAYSSTSFGGARWERSWYVEINSMA